MLSSTFSSRVFLFNRFVRSRRVNRHASTSHYDVTTRRSRPRDVVVVPRRRTSVKRARPKDPSESFRRGPDTVYNYRAGRPPCTTRRRRRRWMQRCAPLTDHQVGEILLWDPSRTDSRTTRPRLSFLRAITLSLSSSDLAAPASRPPPWPSVSGPH